MTVCSHRKDSKERPEHCFQSPACGELRATVNPRNNLAHYLSCKKNFNNIDLMMTQGHAFLPAVDILENWLEQYQRELGQAKRQASSLASLEFSSDPSLPSAIAP